MLKSNNSGGKLTGSIAVPLNTHYVCHILSSLLSLWPPRASRVSELLQQTSFTCLPRECWGFTSWRLRIWRGRINFSEGWSRASLTPTASCRLATSYSRARRWRRVSIRNGTKFMRWWVWDVSWRMRVNVGELDPHSHVFCPIGKASIDFLCEQASIWPCLPQALVYEHSGQHLEIELFDEDPDKDDFLGRWAPLISCFTLKLITSTRRLCLHAGKKCLFFKHFLYSHMVKLIHMEFTHARYLFGEEHEDF